MTPPSSTTDERPERIARLAQTLAEVAALKPHELTPQQRVALHDLADLAQGEVQRTEEALPSVPSSPRGVAAARRLVLTIFGVAMILIVVFTTTSYRVARAFIADSHELVQARAAAAGSAAESPLVAAKSALVAEEAERLSGMMIVSGVARAVVLLLALFLIFRSLAAREKAEVELMSSRDAALSAAEARRVAQAEAEKLGERLRAVLDHIDVGVLMIESDGTITVYNMAAERIHGAWREQMERLKQAGAMTPMLADEKTVIPPGESPMGRALKGETVRDAHVFFRTPFRPNGYHLNVSAAPLRSHLGLLTGAVLMFSERRPEQPLGK
ncbi:MAG TPA: PAS domain-containing protein [Elusimicrobiota bacterium]|nr:PAS domain-containing protein [Elusimicrobiota bacterium]